MNEEHYATLQRMADERDGDDTLLNIQHTRRRGWKVSVPMVDGRFGLTDEESEALREITNEYEDTLIALADADENLSGVERSWEIGRVFVNELSEDESIDTSVLNMSSLRFTDSELFRCKTIYKTFPDKSFNPNHTQTLVSQVARVFKEDGTHLGAYQPGKEAYERMCEQRPSEPPTQLEVRAWGDVESRQNESLESIAECVQMHSRESDSSRTKHNAVRGVLKLVGADSDDYSPSEIADSLQSATQ